MVLGKKKTFHLQSGKGKEKKAQCPLLPPLTLAAPKKIDVEASFPPFRERKNGLHLQGWGKSWLLLSNKKGGRGGKKGGGGEGDRAREKKKKEHLLLTKRIISRKKEAFHEGKDHCSHFLDIFPRGERTEEDSTWKREELHHFWPGGLWGERMCEEEKDIPLATQRGGERSLSKEMGPPLLARGKKEEGGQLLLEKRESRIINFYHTR